LIHDNNIGFIPEKKFISVEHLMIFTVTTLHKYEEQVTNLVRNQISIKNRKDAKTCARILVKGSKMIIIFFAVRRILIGIILVTFCKSNVFIIPPTEPFGFVEFIIFLLVLIWYQKRSYQTGKSSSEPRKIELWG